MLKIEHHGGFMNDKSLISLWRLCTFLGNSTISKGVSDRNGDEGCEFNGDTIDGNTIERCGGLLVC
jgi:hypothetical protein